MHPALKIFLTEYQNCLKATEEKTEKTRKKFTKLQKQIHLNGVTDDILGELFSIAHSLFQSNYLLMETHMRVDNIRANYSAEDQKIIDSYEKVSEKATLLVRIILDYKRTLTSTAETTKSDGTGVEV